MLQPLIMPPNCTELKISVVGFDVFVVAVRLCWAEDDFGEDRQQRGQVRATSGLRNACRADCLAWQLRKLHIPQYPTTKRIFFRHGFGRPCACVGRWAHEAFTKCRLLALVGLPCHGRTPARLSSALDSGCPDTQNEKVPEELLSRPRGVSAERRRDAPD